MTIYNYGSINLDLVYRVTHLPQPGETLSSLSLEKGLGGKGANQSVAIAKAGGTVFHLGAVCSDGDKLLQQMSDAGVDVTHVASLDDATGHAVIYVDDEAENAIVLHPGANEAHSLSVVEKGLCKASQGDWLLMQNETKWIRQAAALEITSRMKTAFAAAPFNPDVVDDVLGHIDLLAVNEIEAEQLKQSLPHRTDDLNSIDMLVTRGADGAEFRGRDGTTIRVPAFSVNAVDTTGAGDTYLGYFLACLDAGLSIEPAMTRASAASALQVTKPGASEAIPDAKAVDIFLDERQGT